MFRTCGCCWSETLQVVEANITPVLEARRAIAGFSRADGRGSTHRSGDPLRQTKKAAIDRRT